jgi:hypothetical protein
MIWAVGHRLAPQAMKRIERSMGTSNANRDTWRAKAAISAVSGLESGHWLGCPPAPTRTHIE